MILKKISEMIRVVIFVILIVLNVYSYAQPKEPKLRSMYENKDGTYNWYIIDTLKFETPTFIRDEYNQTYLIPAPVDMDTLSINRLMYIPDIYIIKENLMTGWSLFFMDYMELSKFEDYIPSRGIINYRYGIEKQNWNYSKENKIATFNYMKRPFAYLFFLMTGKSYNYMTYKIVMDGPILKPIDFPDENAYYKILVPIWEEAMP